MIPAEASASSPLWLQFLLGIVDALWVLLQTLIIGSIMIGLRFTFNFWPTNELLTEAIGYVGEGIYLALLYPRFKLHASKSFAAFQAHFAGAYLVNIVGVVLIGLDVFRFYLEMPDSKRMTDLISGLISLIVLAALAFVAYSRTQREVAEST